MKTIKVFFLSLIFSAIASTVLAAGTCTTPVISRDTSHTFPATALMVSFTCTADAADGSIPDVDITEVGGFLMAVYVDDGSTGITDVTMDIAVSPKGTDINLLGDSGTDINISAGYATLPAMSTYSSTQAYLAGFAGELTVSFTGNAVISANPKIILIFAL